MSFFATTDPASWVAVGLALVGLVIAYLAYRSQRGKTRLEYVVVTNSALVPRPVAGDVQVSHNGVVIENPSLAIVRIVNTGDRPITAEDFETDLVVMFEGTDALASAAWTATRPADLRPDLEIAESSVRVKATLINPGDMLQLQVLAAGKASDVNVAGRITNLSAVPKRDLPYPPGSGKEGEMEGFDRFMWYVLQPGLILGLGLYVALSSDHSAVAVLLILASTAVLLVLDALVTRYLVRRRALWRP